MTTLNPILRGSEREKPFEKFKLDWIFDKWYEKLIIAGMLFWSVFSLIKFVVGLAKYL